MPNSANRSTALPASRLSPTLSRHVGFLTANRRVLAAGAIAACGLLTSIPSLPAQAEVFAGEAPVAGQSFTAAGTVVEAPVERDAFSISTFSVVQLPVTKGTPISSGFGFRECDGCTTDHKGTDFNPGNGAPVFTIADGVVTDAGWDATGYGYRIVVEHDIDGQKVSTLYAHLLDGSIDVAVGDKIERGQTIGKVGQTGEATGPHLHFAVIVDGGMIDPEPWLAEHVNA